MTSTVIFTIIVVILATGFAFELLLETINYRKLSPELPPEAENIYDKEKYEKQYRYQKTNFRFDVLQDSFSFLITLCMIIFFGFAYTDTVIREYIATEKWVVISFFGVLYFLSGIISLPFSVYHTFRIEANFGFNKTTVRTFILDIIKGWFISLIIGIPVLLAVFWFYQQTAGMFWIYTLLLVTFIMLFFAFFYSNLIVPLFNKQTPLEGGELKNAINEFAAGVNFPLKNIYVIDGSKRSTKANAYFTGLGKKKRIVLYDTLIKDLTTSEIVAVLAHEIGHYKKKHTLLSIVTSIVQTGITLYILSLFLGSVELSRAMGVDKPSFHIALISFGILYSPVSLVLGILNNLISRKNEYAADKFASRHFNGHYLASALKKLTVNNLSNLTPHPLFVFFHYSHPTVLQRIKKINSYSKNNEG